MESKSRPPMTMRSKMNVLRKNSQIRRKFMSEMLGLNPVKAMDSFLTYEERRQANFRKEIVAAPSRLKLDDTDLLVNLKQKKSEIDWDDVAIKEDDKGPKNDYCQHFVDTSQRPQNFIRDAGLNDRFEEYPKLRELIKLKDDLIVATNSPPMYLKCNFEEKFSLTELDYQFDVILVEPPLEEYKLTNGVHFKKYMNWDQIKELDIENIAAQRSYIFLWCGSADGLDKGRECLKKWGFRRCEDICWIKTNKENPRHNPNLPPNAVFQRTREHCLMGIKGTVRRSVDNDFIHANVDIDLIISEQPDYGNPDKPEEIFHIIEHFCLGRRRLYLFGRDNTVRAGWLTLGPELTSSYYDKEKYKSYFEPPNSQLTGCTDRIEMLRPKSPPLKIKQQQQQQQQQQAMYSNIPQQQPDIMLNNQYMNQQQQPQSSQQNTQQQVGF